MVLYRYGICKIIYSICTISSRTQVPVALVYRTDIVPIYIDIVPVALRLPLFDHGVTGWRGGRVARWQGDE